MAIPLFAVERVTLIDASWLVYRSFWSPQAESISKFTGVPSAGPLVMLYQSIQKVYRDFTNPIFVLDGYPIDKATLYPEYKGNRTAAREADPDAKVKSDTRKSLRNSLVQTLPTVVSYIHDQEADDTIASIAVQLKAKGVDVHIISSDRDLWQLHQSGIKLWIPGDSGYRDVTDAMVEDTFGTPAIKIPLCKSWLGDKSDNIPKIPRLPSKLVKGIINDSETLQDTIDRVHMLPPNEKWKKPMIEFIPQAKINYQIVKIRTHLVPRFAYFRLDSQYLQNILDAFMVRNFNAYELYQVMIPAQDATVHLLHRHGMLNNNLTWEEVYKN
jgi:5'-3' exonuclease